MGDDELSYTDKLNSFLNRAGFLEELCAFIANGGSPITFCELKEIRYSDVMKWVGAEEKRIAAFGEAEIQRVEFTKRRIELELSHVALADITLIFRDDGSLKPMSQWPKSVAAAVAGVEIDELFEGTGKDRAQVGWVKKAKMWDKIRALELWGRERGMFKEKHVHEGTLTLEQLVVESRKPAEGGKP